MSRISIMGGSFLYHFYRPDFTRANEFFGNRLIAVNYRLKSSNEIFFGTALASGGERIAVLGFVKKWYHFNENIALNGLYGYGGNFFIPALSGAGEGGVYRQMKEKTGIAFAPYIFHSVELKLTNQISFYIGHFLPLSFCTMFQLHI